MLRIVFLALILSTAITTNAKAIEVDVADQKSTNEIAGSIVVTENINKIQNFANNNGLKIKSIHGIDSSNIIAIEEEPSDKRVQSMSILTGNKVKPNYVYKSLFTPNDANYSAQWNMAKISAPYAWEIERGDSNITIAIIDTGVLFEQTINGTTYSQPDFPNTRLWNNAGEIGTTESSDPCWMGAPEDKSTNGCDDDENGFIDDWQGWDFMGGYRGNDEGCPNHNDATTYQSGSDPDYLTQDNDPNPYSCDSPTSQSTLNKDHYDGTCMAFSSACYVGHGTMVASVAAAETDNNELVAGIDHNAKIMNVRTLDGYGFSTTARVAAAIEYAAENGADVINMSLGSNCNNNSFIDSVTEAAITVAKNAGVVMVAASGNNGYGNSICYPASSSEVIAVGATNSSDNLQSYSNYSNKLEVVAPAGVPVANAPSNFINNNYYSNAHGTSLSTPHVAGLASIIKSTDSGLTRDQIRKAIRNRADIVSSMNSNTKTNQYGYGRINMRTTIFVLNERPPVYRLYNENNKRHFYTAGLLERNKVLGRDDYRFSGISFWSRTSSVGTLPVYRLYHPQVKKHFYTINESERNKAINEQGYRDGGVGFRVFDDVEPNVIPVYRLYHPVVKNHLYTISSSERNKAINELGYRDGGAKFYAE